MLPPSILPKLLDLDSEEIFHCLPMVNDDVRDGIMFGTICAEILFLRRYTANVHFVVLCIHIPPCKLLSDMDS